MITFECKECCHKWQGGSLNNISCPECGERHFVFSGEIYAAKFENNIVDNRKKEKRPKV